MAKKEKKQGVKCWYCQYAYLMYEVLNPILAGCKCDHQVRVASTPFACENYKQLSKDIIPELHKMIKRQ